MHTLIMTLAGVAVLGLFLGAARLRGRPEVFPLKRAAHAFIPLWAVAAAANGAVGYLTAGIPLRTELLVFAVVFGVPAALAWLAGRRFA